MPIHSDKNLYPGINPHLNSALQKRNGGWQSFHKDHITHLRELLDRILPDAYYAASETSLQIGTYDPETHESVAKAGLITPDVTVYRSKLGDEQSALPTSGGSPTLTIPLVETLDEMEDISSILIYHIEGGELPGKAVTRIELLSPANKPFGSYYRIYLTKRTETLHSGLRLVEIDYLHEDHPVISRIPSYPEREDNAYPYSIIVNDPRPTVSEGKTDIYGFGVLSALPLIDIPLDGIETVKVNFGTVYNHTFETSRLLRLLVNYEQEPINFQAYSQGDQELIRQHMAAIKAQQR